MKDKKDDLFKAPLSSEFKNKVQKAVQMDLEFNKKQNSLIFFKKFSFPIIASCAFGFVLYFQLLSPLDSQNLNFDTNLIMELSALSPDEVEVIENLEFMDALDKLTPEEIEEMIL